jgi:hypothetical protein
VYPIKLQAQPGGPVWPDAVAVAGSVREPVTRPGKLPKIKGCVAPRYQIEAYPSEIPAGRHGVVVKDRAGGHNWRMTGPGDVDASTTVSGEGRWVWRLKLKKGTNEIYCDPHASFMKRSLAVT